MSKKKQEVPPPIILAIGVLIYVVGDVVGGMGGAVIGIGGVVILIMGLITGVIKVFTKKEIRSVSRTHEVQHPITQPAISGKDVRFSKLEKRALWRFFKVIYITIATTLGLSAAILMFGTAIDCPYQIERYRSDQDAAREILSNAEIGKSGGSIWTELSTRDDAQATLDAPIPCNTNTSFIAAFIITPVISFLLYGGYLLLRLMLAYVMFGNKKE